ncbi:MAG: hypothetical protein DDT29_01218 [Dehalococcoidia bacterium]|nr:hypothetical protein [Bacillota bacterium]
MLQAVAICMLMLQRLTTQLDCLCLRIFFWGRVITIIFFTRGFRLPIIFLL